MKTIIIEKVFCGLLCDGDLQGVGWVWSSSWVLGGVWCDAPVSGAPWTAARPDRQTLCLLE